MSIAVDLAPKGPEHPWFVEVLDHDNLWSRRRSQVAAILGPAVWIGLAMGGIARLNHDRDGLADHRTHLGHEIASFFEVERVSRGIMPGDLFPTIIDCRSIPAFQLEQFSMGKLVARGRGR